MKKLALAILLVTSCGAEADWQMCWDPLIVPGGVFLDGDGDVGDDMSEQLIPIDRVGQNATGQFVVGFPRSRSSLDIPGYTGEIMLWKIGDFDPNDAGDLFDQIGDDEVVCVECLGDGPPGQVVSSDCEVSDSDLNKVWTCTLPPWGVPFAKDWPSSWPEVL